MRTSRSKGITAKANPWSTEKAQDILHIVKYLENMFMEMVEKYSRLSAKRVTDYPRLAYYGMCDPKVKTRQTVIRHNPPSQQLASSDSTLIKQFHHICLKLFEIVGWLKMV